MSLSTPSTRLGRIATTVTALLVVLATMGPVGSALAAPVGVSQTATTSTTVAPGETVTLQTTVTSTDANGPAIDLTLPAGWTVTAHADDGGTYKESTQQWVWLSGNHTVEYTVSVPADAAPGTYDLSAEGSGIVDGTRQTATTSTTITVEEPQQNTAPVADAGSDQTVTEGDAVSLDATGSSDPDGDSLSYAWTETSGAGVTLQDANTATPTFTAPSVSSETTLTFEVTVSDGQASDTDTVAVTVQPAEPTNQAPVADAGSDQTVTEGDAVSLDATGSSDPDGDSLSYSWTETSTVGVGIQDANTATPTFTAPTVSVETTLTFEVTVSDGQASDTDTVSVTVEPETPTNQAPIADAGSDQTVDENTSVSLDATGSSDPDGDALTYAWTETSGAGVTLQDANTATPTFTAPTVTSETTLTFEVTVSDGQASDTDTVAVTVQPVEPEPSPNAQTDVNLSPSSAELVVDETATFDVVVEDVDGGVGAYTATVAVDDPSVATITDVTVHGTPSPQTVSTEFAADNSSVTINAALMDTVDTGSVSIATVTVTGESTGDAGLSLTVDALGDENAVAYDVTGTGDATLSVLALGPVGDYANPPNDPDGDGVYEDVNGDGTFDILDVQALFVNMGDETVQNNPAQFDMNGDGEFNVIDVQALFLELIS